MRGSGSALAFQAGLGASDTTMRGAQFSAPGLGTSSGVDFAPSIHGGAATRVIRATNSEPSPFFYVIDPREQMRIMDAIDDAGEDLVAIYHSHTRSAAFPSRTDVELGFFPQTPYLIVSIADRDAPDIRAYRLSRGAPEGEQIHEEEVLIG